jgi:hypothetical protein
MHPHLSKKLSKRSTERTNEENTAAYWIKNGQKAVKERLARKINTSEYRRGGKKLIGSKVMHED